MSHNSRSRPLDVTHVLVVRVCVSPSFRPFLVRDRRSPWSSLDYFPYLQRSQRFSSLFLAFPVTTMPVPTTLPPSVKRSTAPHWPSVSTPTCRENQTVNHPPPLDLPVHPNCFRTKQKLSHPVQLWLPCSGVSLFSTSLLSLLFVIALQGVSTFEIDPTPHTQSDFVSSRSRRWLVVPSPVHICVNPKI